MPRHDVFDLMRRSLDTIAAEVPEADAALRKAIGPLVTRLTSEGRARRLHATPSGLTLDEAGDGADVEIAFDRAIVLDLAEGRMTLEEALIADQLMAKGSVSAISQFHDGLMIYLEGLLRAPGAAALYEAYCET